MKKQTFEMILAVDDTEPDARRMKKGGQARCQDKVESNAKCSSTAGLITAFSVTWSPVI